MNQPAPAQLPYRLSERAFRVFEDDIALIVESLPGVVELTPKTLSPNTYAARLRDAISSLNQFNWTTTKVDMKEFFYAYTQNQIQVSHTNEGKIYGGSPHLIKLRIKSVVGGTANVSAERTILAPHSAQSQAFTVVTYGEKALIARLASAGLLTGVLIDGLTEENVEHFENIFDVSFKCEADGTWRIL